MKKSVAPAPPIDDRSETAPVPELEFPVAPDFVSRPPRLDFQVILKRCAETMPWRSTQPGERERRRAQAIPIEFVL